MSQQSEGPVVPDTDGELRMSNGHWLFWRKNEAGGRTYYSDEVGNGVVVWDTCLVDIGTLMAAFEKEVKLRVEDIEKELREQQRDAEKD